MIADKRPTRQEIEERKINMVRERGSRVLLINSPLGSTLFTILRQFDMAFSDFTGRLCGADPLPLLPAPGDRGVSPGNWAAG